MLHIKNKLMALWSKLLPLLKRGMAACKKAGRQIRLLLIQAGRLTLRHRLATTVIASMLILTMLMSVMTVSIHHVEVYDEGEKIASYFTVFKDEASILERNGLTLGAGDERTLEEDGNNISLRIERGFPIYIKADGLETLVMMADGTVGDALKKAGLTCGSEDLINLELNAELKSGMRIKLDRVTTKTIEKTVELDYETEEIKTNDLYIGNSKTVQKGEKGSKKCTYTVTYINGKEADRTLIKEEILEEPVNEIIKIGTKIKSSFKKTSSTPKKYKKVMAMECTAYAAGGSTATGRPAQWGVIAVDPRVIPLGTKVYVETADGKFIYGTAIAADIGGAIKGNIIDICVNTRAEAYAFGRRIVNVYIL